MSPDPGIIAGVVSDREGVAVPEARVSFVAGPSALPDIAALTDSRGRFTLSAPVPGDYTIQCAADGYAPGKVKVSVASGQRIEVNCRLES
jgi:hypothetical protein